MNKLDSPSRPPKPQSRLSRISSLHMQPQPQQHQQSNFILPSLYSQTSKTDQQHSQKITDLKRSHSVSTIIHGNPNIGSPLNPNISKLNHHYIDSLQRFHRDHASKDKQQREIKRIMKQKTLEKKRQLKINRQVEYKQKQYQNYQKTIQQNQKAIQKYQTGTLRNSFTNSIPVNPITLKYQNNQMGRYQQYIDDDKKIKNLIRTHHLQTMGTSGYNIINGIQQNYTDKLLPKGQENQIKYQENLVKYYSNFSINNHMGNGLIGNGQMGNTGASHFIGK